MKSAVLLTVFVADLVLFVGLCLYSTILSHKITELVNRKRGRPYSLWWWTWQKQNAVFRDYRDFYPDGSLVRTYWRVVVLIVAAWAVAAFLLFG